VLSGGVVTSPQATGESADAADHVVIVSVPTIAPVAQILDSHVMPVKMMYSKSAVDQVADNSSQANLITELPVSVATLSFESIHPNANPLPTPVIVLVDEWGRDTCIINEVCELIEAMPHPWSAYRAFKAASARFPNIDRAALRLAVMAVLMGQRRCVNRLTTAGLLGGPRRDEDGAAYIELNNACANEYRYSF